MVSSLIHYEYLSPLSITCSVLVLVISYYLSRKWLNPRGKLVSAPEAPGGWPIFGHLSLLKGPNPTHKTLGSIADKLGPIFSIRIGSHQGLVVSSAELAKECFTGANDLALASRPDLIASKHIGYDNAMFGFAPYGPFWREMRKIATVELLSNHRLERLRHVTVSEVAVFVKELHKGQHQVLVEMKEHLSDMSLNIILRMVAGKRYSNSGDLKESRDVQRAIKEFFSVVGLFVPGDAIPWLRWLDLGGYEKAVKKTAKELDGIIGQWLEEHKLKREANMIMSSEQDFMDVLITVLHDSDFAGYDSDTINKATVLNLIAGGADTTTVTLTWAISLLLNNRHVLKKAQEELDRHVGKSRVVDTSDIANLSYIQAIVKETLRLYPAAPLSAPHVFTKDCTVGGYHAAKGTRLITNLWKIQTDLKFWPDPFDFKPERFLTTHKGVDVRGQNFELIPFGSGRRSCPGTSFALKTAHFTLARFLQGFEISTPLNVDVDMTEGSGLTNLKATPLELLITPRLPTELYG